MKTDRKKRITLPRHWFLLRIIRFFFGPIFKAKYRFKNKYYRYRSIGPSLILCSHTVAIDPIFMDTMFDFPIYFVATEQILNKGFTSKALRYIFAPLAKSKSIANISLITNMKKIFDEGGNVGLFPEGEVSITGETKRIAPSIGKLISIFKVPVVFVHSYGLYFSNARWSRVRKYGKTGMYVHSILRPEEYQDKTAEEITETVNKEIYINAYEQTPKYRYKGRRRAEGLERLLFVCPSCHKPNTLKTARHDIFCTECDYKGTYDEYGYLNVKGEKRDLIALDRDSKVEYVKYLKEHYEDFSLKDTVDIYYYVAGEVKKTKRFRHKIEINKDGLFIYQKNDEVLHYDFGQIISFAMQFKNRFLIYVHGNLSLYIGFDRFVSTYQYLLTLQVFSDYYHYLKGEQQDAYLLNPDAAVTLGV